MPLTAEVKKLTDSKPFYAVAGAGDYAVEKLRELPVQLQKLQLTELTKELPEKARVYATKAEEVAKELPEKAREYADQLTHRAVAVYEEFADRGRKVVSRTTGEAALELEEVSEAAEPAVAAKATTRKPRTPRAAKA
jgi:hypothetical protein